MLVLNYELNYYTRGEGEINNVSFRQIDVRGAYHAGIYLNT